MRKSGNKLRITTQLIDSINDAHLWNQSRRQKILEDVFAIQSEIAQQVVAALEIKLFSKRKKKLKISNSRGVMRPHTLFLKGRYCLNERSKESVDRAEYFEKVIELDASFGLAYAGLADCYIVYADYAWLVPEKRFGE